MGAERNFHISQTSCPFVLVLSRVKMSGVKRSSGADEEKNPLGDVELSDEDAVALVAISLMEVVAGRIDSTRAYVDVEIE